MKELAWLACRALELFAGSLLCLWLIAPGPSEDPIALFEVFARTAILVGFYHVLSLYFVSCVALGYFWRRQDPLKQAGSWQWFSPFMRFISLTGAPPGKRPQFFQLSPSAQASSSR